jgi:hypothetical protein
MCIKLQINDVTINYGKVASDSFTRRSLSLAFFIAKTLRLQARLHHEADEAACFIGRVGGIFYHCKCLAGENFFTIETNITSYFCRGELASWS